MPLLPTKKKEPLPAKKTPTPIPANKIPTPKKTPTPKPVKKTPTPKAVKKTPPPPPPVKKTPAPKPVKKTPPPPPPPVKKTPTPKPVKKTPPPPPVKKTPTPPPVKKTPTPKPVKKTPPPPPPKKTPTPKQVNKTPTPPPVKKSSAPVLPRAIARDNNFFHEHALNTLTIDDQDHIKCSVCDTNIHGEVYGCDKFLQAKFYMHKTCVNLPKTICHPSHVVASLNLRAHSPDQSGQIICNCCGEKCDSFHYHSNHNFDLHIGCAALPSSVTYNQHTFLTLRYYFPLPTEHSTVKCNICSHALQNSRWVYYNVTPKFIAHLSCALQGNGSTAVVIQQRLNAMVPISSRPPTKSFCSRIFGC